MAEISQEMLKKVKNDFISDINSQAIRKFSSTLTM